MKVVVQRVKRAEVRVEEDVKGKIGRGLLLFAGFHKNDTSGILYWVCNKIRKLRIFEDENGKMNRSVQDIQGDVLIISQFTLYGNTEKGTRPSFTDAAKPDMAEPLYNEMIHVFKNETDLRIESGEFGAMMNVDLVNDGPVTIIVEKE